MAQAVRIRSKSNSSTTNTNTDVGLTNLHPSMRSSLTMWTRRCAILLIAILQHSTVIEGGHANGFPPSSLAGLHGKREAEKDPARGQRGDEGPSHAGSGSNWRTGENAYSSSSSEKHDFVVPGARLKDPVSFPRKQSWESRGRGTQDGSLFRPRTPTGVQHPQPELLQRAGGGREEAGTFGGVPGREGRPDVSFEARAYELPDEWDKEVRERANIEEPLLPTHTPFRDQFVHQSQPPAQISGEGMPPNRRTSGLFRQAGGGGVFFIFFVLVWRSLSNYEHVMAHTGAARGWLLVPALSLFVGNLVCLCLALVQSATVRQKGRMKTMLGIDAFSEALLLLYNLGQLLSSHTPQREDSISRVLASAWFLSICFTFSKARWVADEQW